jgi:hypothetical protein
MGTVSTRPDKSSTIEASKVPFLGWSTAAQEFRIKAAEFAPAGIMRPLIIGDPGVGKKTMARAWQYVIDPGVRMPIEVLEELSVKVPERFIGLTVCRPCRGRSCFLLGSGRRGDVPEPQPGKIRLDDAMMQRFELPLYMPPIHPHRPVDVLAFLDYWNRARSPRVGIRYQAIEASLLRRMLFGGDWPGNFESIYGQLRILNHLNRPSSGDLPENRDEDPGEEDKDAEIPPVVLDVLHDRSAHASASSSATSVADRAIPFGMLPDLAVRIYLWYCQHQPLEEPARTLTGEEAGPGLVPASFQPFEAGLAASEFVDLTEEEFVRDHVLPGLPASSARRSDCVAILVDRVRNHQLFGTDFHALQAGLRIDPSRVELAVGRSKPKMVSEAEDAERASIPLGQPPLGRFSSIERDDWVNSFCVRDCVFSISFRTATGSSEEHEFPRQGNSGMAYYRYLLMHPDQEFSSKQIECANGRGEDSPDSTERNAAEWAEIQGGSGFDAVLDEPSKRQIAERLAAIARELAAAERKHDKSRITKLEEEQGQLTTCYEQAVRDPRARRLAEFQQRLKALEEEIAAAERDGDHLLLDELASERQSLTDQVVGIVQGGKDKNLDKSAKQAQDRVRKVMEDARKKFALGHLVQLVGYLERTVQYKNGAWAYRPSRSSHPWRT